MFIRRTCFHDEEKKSFTHMCEQKRCRFIHNENTPILMKQLDLAPPSLLARAEASFGRVHLTALGGIRELQQKEQDDNGDDDLFAVTHLNP